MTEFVSETLPVIGIAVALLWGLLHPVRGHVGPGSLAEAANCRVQRVGRMDRNWMGRGPGLGLPRFRCRC